MKKKTARLYCIFLQVNIIFWIFLLQSRSSWLALVIGLILLNLDFKAGLLVQYKKGTMHNLLILLFGSGVAVLIFPHILSLIVEMMVNRASDFNSYVGRASVVEDAINQVFILQIYSESHYSSHNFMLDAGLSSDFLGFALAFIIYFSLVFKFYEKLRFNNKTALFVSSIPFFVRMVSAGSGIPGIIEFAGLATILIRVSARKKGIKSAKERKLE